MESLDDRWNNQVDNFHMKVNKLRCDMNEYKKGCYNAYNLRNNKNDVFEHLQNNNMKRRELIHMNNNYEINNYLKKPHNQTYILKDDKNSNVNDVTFPVSKNISNKVIKTNEEKILENKCCFKLNVRNKRKNEKIIKINEKRWLIATKHVKIERVNKTGIEQNEEEKNKKDKNRYIYLEGEEGNLHLYPMYSDSEVGFENISHIEDESLSKVKKENQDDDDIMTTKHLAQWSSDIVHKYLEEAIEKTKSIFQNFNMESRQKEIFKRIKL
ncbi:conserved Plasmodium protein, unknown function [Plasmodium sp. gorilla clade G2]|uniref:conserved Plasmodium protein, unknown function n=1 Tax=Plasmodium sp. gorilla clade G2 TaxID=880535 RepID=UPI000D21C7BA|nr:conserved Plasmodium protein, unknown function [Plasmodium sp. gorilla clade G2]SOV18445.1 conserved Plasmodium protein, unknown function [Plasmodium sp. gorilla clade G2]